MQYSRKYILLLLMIALCINGWWIYQIMNHKLPYLDQWTRDPVIGLDEDSILYEVFRFLTDLGSWPFIIPFVIIMAVVFWFLYQDWLPAVILSGGTLLTHYINVAIKHLVDRERPSILVAANAEGHSFPSGHAMIPMVCYGLCAYFLSQRLQSSKRRFIIEFFFAMLIFLIGISRYIINVHYLTDVLAGFLIGFLCLLVSINLYQWLQKKRCYPSRG